MYSRHSYRLYAPIILVLFVLGCTGGNQSPDDVGRSSPSYQLSDPETIAQAESLADSGYALLDLERYDEAIVLMKESQSILPTSRYAHYNLACAYNRSDDRSAALAELALAVDAGWDDPGHIGSDPDLASLREDSSFINLLDRVKANQTERLQALARGLPEVEFDRSFPNADSLDAWARNESRTLYQRGRHLFGWQRMLARIELDAKRIAARRLLDPPDTTFDEGLERVRALGNAQGPWQAWGPIAEGTHQEVRNYLAANPASESRDEAFYMAGAAAYCKTLPDSEDPGWSEAVRDAREWFSRIADESEFEGGAAAWNLMFDLREAGKDKSALQSRLRGFAAKFGDDRRAMNVASYFFMDDVIRAEWPIPFEAMDMEGKEVTLDQFRGKTVLLCYWATW
ncbi:hypothetical protein ACFL6M_01945 [Candidatus Eisenbacteria bacterium]|uniref:Redoxin domain-containing protein n=1 Tax=Eiseniibacteriota bacterium TaxID=2212470 RepID=A0ABV6YJ41_UNCEI